MHQLYAETEMLHEEALFGRAGLALKFRDPLFGYIAHNSFFHYREPIERVRRWLERRGRRRSTRRCERNRRKSYARRQMLKRLGFKPQAREKPSPLKGLKTVRSILKLMKQTRGVSRKTYAQRNQVI